jgi:hypothetical protein
MIIHCLTPMLLGGLLYVLFRSTNLRMFNWFTFFGLENLIQYARINVLQIKNYMPSWVYFSLPDGLWVYSFTSSILIYWNNEWQKAKIWLLIPFIGGCLIEILQRFDLFSGTFDILDLTFSILGIFLSKIYINFQFKKNE